MGSHNDCSNCRHKRISALDYRRKALAEFALKAILAILVGVFPLASLFLEALTDWTLTAENVTLYVAGIGGLVVAVYRLKAGNNGGT